MLTAINPTTGKTLHEFPALNADGMYAHIAAAHNAYPEWRKQSFNNRAEVLRGVAARLRDNKDELARLMALEMGKPIKEGVPEVEKAAGCAEFYADNAERFLAREELPSDASLSYVCYQPLGTILGILPWNAPLWLAFRFLAPALMAGNTCVLKHDPHTPACAEAILKAFADAPEDIAVNLPLTNDLVEQAIRAPDIAAVSFTGSSNAGKKVATVAASELKPAVLELGGSDPCIVLADADLDTAADVATLSRIINAGQSCIAAKRIIVEEKVYGEFVHMLSTRLQKLKLGDPTDSGTDIGPIARPDLRDNLHRQVSATIEAGARCHFGGELPQRDGFFYPVTLLSDVTPDMCAFREETFGPVMVVTPAKSLEDALTLANDTDYGLGAAIWTGNAELAEQTALEIEAGQVAINGIVKTDPRLPSGGIKQSGYGRELGPHGIREFVNAKQVWIK